MSRNKGFTLIELLVVIAIIGVLAAVVLAGLNSARERGNQAAVKSNMATVATQSELYYDTNNDYGTEQSTPENCVTTPTAGTLWDDDETVATAITAAENAGTGASSFCASIQEGAGTAAQSWAASVAYRDGSGRWCVDSTGYKGETDTTDADGLEIIDSDGDTTNDRAQCNRP